MKIKTVFGLIIALSFAACDGEGENPTESPKESELMVKIRKKSASDYREFQWILFRNKRNLYFSSYKTQFQSSIEEVNQTSYDDQLYSHWLDSDFKTHDSLSKALIQYQALTPYQAYLDQIEKKLTHKTPEFFPRISFAVTQAHLFGSFYPPEKIEFLDLEKKIDTYLKESRDLTGYELYKFTMESLPEEIELKEPYLRILALRLYDLNTSSEEVLKFQENYMDELSSVDHVFHYLTKESFSLNRKTEKFNQMAPISPKINSFQSKGISHIDTFSKIYPYFIKEWKDFEDSFECHFPYDRLKRLKQNFCLYTRQYYKTLIEFYTKPQSEFFVHLFYNLNFDGDYFIENIPKLNEQLRNSHSSLSLFQAAELTGFLKNFRNKDFVDIIRDILLKELEEYHTFPQSTQLGMELKDFDTKPLIYLYVLSLLSPDDQVIYFEYQKIINNSGEFPNIEELSGLNIKLDEKPRNQSLEQQKTIMNASEVAYEDCVKNTDQSRLAKCIQIKSFFENTEFHIRPPSPHSAVIESIKDFESLTEKFKETCSSGLLGELELDETSFLKGTLYEYGTLEPPSYLFLILQDMLDKRIEIEEKIFFEYKRIGHKNKKKMPPETIVLLKEIKKQVRESSHKQDDLKEKEDTFLPTEHFLFNEDSYVLSCIRFVDLMMHEHRKQGSRFANDFFNYANK